MGGPNSIDPGETSRINNERAVLAALMDVTARFDQPSPEPPKSPVQAADTADVDQWAEAAMDPDPTAYREEGEGYDRKNDPFKCVQCPRSFIESAAYNKHVNAHNKLREARYICDFCNKRYNNFNRMTTHMYLRHNYALPYACIICESKFKTIRSLNRHRRAQHPRAIFIPSQHGRHARLITCLVSSDIAEKVERREVLVLSDHLPYARTNAVPLIRSRRLASDGPANPETAAAPMYDSDYMDSSP